MADTGLNIGAGLLGGATQGFLLGRKLRAQQEESEARKQAAALAQRKESRMQATALQNRLTGLVNILTAFSATDNKTGLSKIPPEMKAILAPSIMEKFEVDPTTMQGKGLTKIVGAKDPKTTQAFVAGIESVIKDRDLVKILEQDPTLRRQYNERPLEFLTQITKLKKSKDEALREKQKAAREEELRQPKLREAKADATIAEQKAAVGKERAKIFEQLGTGVATKGPLDKEALKNRISQLTSMAAKLAVVDPAASRAMSQAAAQLRLSPGGVVNTEVAKAIGKQRGEELKPVGSTIAQALNRPQLADLSREVLSKIRVPWAPSGVRIPEPGEMKGIVDRKSALAEIQNTSRNIIRIVENNPKALGVPSTMARFVGDMAATFKGFADLLPDIVNQIPGVDTLRISLDGELGKLNVAALESADARSAVIALTFQGASMMQKGNRRFSNQTFENVSKQIGAATADPERMVGVIRSFNLLQGQALDRDIQSRTGIIGFTGVPNVDVERPFGDLSIKALSAVVPELLNDDLWGKLKLERQSRLER